MKTLYLAYEGMTVYGMSLESRAEARANAISWLEETYTDDGIDNDCIEISEVEVPDSATEQVFMSCAQVDEYERVAGILREGIMNEKDRKGVHLQADTVNGISKVNIIDVLIDNPNLELLTPAMFYECLAELDDGEVIYTHMDGENEALFDKIEKEYGIN